MLLFKIVWYLATFIVDGLGFNFPYISLLLTLPFFLLSFLRGKIHKSHFKYLLLIIISGSLLLIINRYAQKSFAEEKVEKITIYMDEYYEENRKYPSKLEELSIDNSYLFYRMGLFQIKKRFGYQWRDNKEDPTIAFSVGFSEVYFYSVKTKKWEKVGLFGM